MDLKTIYSKKLNDGKIPVMVLLGVANINALMNDKTCKPTVLSFEFNTEEEVDAFRNGMFMSSKPTVLSFEFNTEEEVDAFRNGMLMSSQWNRVHLLSPREIVVAESHVEMNVKEGTDVYNQVIENQNAVLKYLNSIAETFSDDDPIILDEDIILAKHFNLYFDTELGRWKKEERK